MPARVADEHEIRAMIQGKERPATEEEIKEFLKPRQRVMSPGEFDREKYYKRLI